MTALQCQSMSKLELTCTLTPGSAVRFLFCFGTSMSAAESSIRRQVGALDSEGKASICSYCCSKQAMLAGRPNVSHTHCFDLAELQKPRAVHCFSPFAVSGTSFSVALAFALSSAPAALRLMAIWQPPSPRPCKKSSDVSPCKPRSSQFCIPVCGVQPSEWNLKRCMPGWR